MSRHHELSWWLDTVGNVREDTLQAQDESSRSINVRHRLPPHAVFVHDVGEQRVQPRRVQPQVVKLNRAHATRGVSGYTPSQPLCPTIHPEPLGPPRKDLGEVPKSELRQAIHLSRGKRRGLEERSVVGLHDRERNRHDSTPRKERLSVGRMHRDAMRGIVVDSYDERV